MPRAPDLSGRALEQRYELHSAIGEGAFGRVYRGFDRRLARPVAVKVIKPWWAEDRAWVQRFQREAQLLARVSDHGIVQIFDIGEAEEGPYYVAELVEGESLAQRLERGPLPAGEARTIAERLCLALGSAHQQGVMHCDVKPANVLVGVNGDVKVGDFGVARLAEGTSQGPSATIAGTPRYMSPEQALGRPTTPATDVYSAGVVLYEMLAGKPPFVQGSAVELGLRHLQEPPPRLSARIPPALCQVVDRALAKEPARRYADGAQMAAALAAIEPECPPARASGPAARSANGQAPQSADGQAPQSAEVPTPHTAATVALAERADAGLEAAQTLDVGAIATRIMPNGRQAPAGPTAEAARRARRARRRRGVALAGTLVATPLALAGAAVLVALTGASAETIVPHLDGLPRAGVQARSRRLHVRPAFTTRYSSSVAGIAIAQRPPAGTRIGAGSTVHVVLSAGPPPVIVPDLVGQAASSAETVLADSGLRYRVTQVPAPGSKPGLVTQQSPDAALTVQHGSTVELTVVETPRWRTLTSFSGVDDGTSAPFQIRGEQWRVVYTMSYQGPCMLLVVCFGPSAEAQNVQSGANFGGFELGEGESETHTFHSGPGLYRLQVSGGRDSAQWTMTVEDYY